MINSNPNHLYKVIVIGGSAGSFQGTTRILSNLPNNFPIPIILSMHRLKHVRHGFVEALSIKSVNPVTEPNDKEHIKRGKVYLAPSNYHMMVELGNTFAMGTDDMVNNSRPSIDVTLDTASYVYKDKMIGILLSGANKDGAFGMKKVNERGGLTIVQDPKECFIDTMPSAALRTTEIDHVMSIEKIIAFLHKVNNQIKSV